MNKIPHHNNTDKAIHIGNITILPGGTRDVDPTLLPDAKAKKVEPALVKNTLSEKIAEILNLPISEMQKQLSALSNDELTELEAGENAKPAPRSGALTAIAAARIAMASQKIGGDKAADEFKALIESMADDELAEQNYPAESYQFAIIGDEKNHREAEKFKVEMKDYSADEMAVAKEMYADNPEITLIIDTALAELAKP